MKCCICGKEFEESQWMRPFDDVCSSDCFGEKLWRERERDHKKNPNHYIIIDGELYTDGGYKDTKDTIFLGHGGTLFNIQMESGRKIKTNNLWSGGEIPEKHREILRDNAKFIKEDL